MKIDISDEELISHHWSEHSKDCFEVLYRRYFEFVLQQCLFWEKDEEKAKDYTQEIFIKLYYKLPSFRCKAKFTTWLRSIIRNYCFDQKKINGKILFRDIQDEDFRELMFVEESNAIEENLQNLDKAINILPELDQSILRLKYIHGCSIEYIGEYYNINLSAVKMRLLRSRRRIRNQFIVEF